MPGTEAVVYRREFIKQFNTSISLYKDRGTPESMDLGKSVVFDIAATGGRMQQRSIDGRIPRTNVLDTQVTIPLQEYVKKFEVTDFEAFTSQSNERAKHNNRILETINQEFDFNFKTALHAANNTYSSVAAPMTLDTVTRVLATLAGNQVPMNADDVTFAISSFAEAKLQNIKGYASADYVLGRPLETGGNQYQNKTMVKKWLNATWIVDPNLIGHGTASCTCYVWHRAAVGVAMPTRQIRHGAGYNFEDHYYYNSATIKAAAAIIQQPGIYKFLHNDLA